MPINFNTFLGRLKKKNIPQDILAVDFSQAEPKCCRLRKANGGIQLVAADVLPRIQDDNPAAQEDVPGLIVLPNNLKARHVAICLSGRNALVKLISLPGQLNGESEMKIREDIGAGAGEYRIGYKVLGHSHGRAETKLVTVALPEAEFQHYLGYFATGWPVAVSVELAGLAAVNAFIKGYLDNSEDESLAVVQFEDYVSFFAWFDSFHGNRSVNKPQRIKAPKYYYQFVCFGTFIISAIFSCSRSCKCNI